MCPWALSSQTEGEDIQVVTVEHSSQEEVDQEVEVEVLHPTSDLKHQADVLPAARFALKPENMTQPLDTLPMCVLSKMS